MGIGIEPIRHTGGDAAMPVTGSRWRAMKYRSMRTLLFHSHMLIDAMPFQAFQMPCHFSCRADED